MQEYYEYIIMSSCASAYVSPSLARVHPDVYTWQLTLYSRAAWLLMNMAS